MTEHASRTDEAPWSETHRWLIRAAVTALIAVYIPVITALTLQDEVVPMQGAEVARLVMAGFVGGGILLTGAGAVMRASVHDDGKTVLKHNVDGWGKIAGVAGWGVGAPSAIIYGTFDSPMIRPLFGVLLAIGSIPLFVLYLLYVAHLRRATKGIDFTGRC